MASGVPTVGRQDMPIPDDVKERVLQQVANMGECTSPAGKRRAELQQHGLGLLAARQRAVLPPGKTCGMWSFAIPWGPFAHYITTRAPEAKPFLWSQPFRLGGAEFSAFWGMEQMDAEGGRLCLWMSIGNSRFQPVTAYSKIEIWMPGSVDVSPCGEIYPVGDAVDTFGPCGEGSHTRFWWHLGPEDVSPNLFRAAFDAEDERSFEVLISLRLDVKDPRTRSPAREEDPHLFDFSKRYLEPWLHGIMEARVSAITTPLQTRIAALEAESEGMSKQRLRELREAAEREEDRIMKVEVKAEERRLMEVNQLSERISNLSHHVQRLEDDLKEKEDLRRKVEAFHRDEMAAAKQREETLERKVANVEEQKRVLQTHVAKQEEQLREAAAREQQLQSELMASRQREQMLQTQLQASQRQVQTLTEQLNQTRQKLSEAQQMIAQLQQQLAATQQQLASTQQRAEALRRRGEQLEQMIHDGAEREQDLRNQLEKVREYVQGTKQREDKFRFDIASLEAQLRQSREETGQLQQQIKVMEGQCRQAAEQEAMLRVSNTRLLAAAVDEHGRVDAIHNSPQRQRLAQGGFGAAR